MTDGRAGHSAIQARPYAARSYVATIGLVVEQRVDHQRVTSESSPMGDRFTNCSPLYGVCECSVRGAGRTIGMEHASAENAAQGSTSPVRSAEQI
jgi:hypothetical protein